MEHATEGSSSGRSSFARMPLKETLMVLGSCSTTDHALDIEREGRRGEEEEVEEEDEEDDDDDDDDDAALGDSRAPSPVPVTGDE